MPVMLAIGAPIIGGLAGQALSQGDKDKARAAMEAAAAQYNNLKSPSFGPIDFQQLKSAGVLSPAQEQAILQGPSSMQGISTDPRLKEAQMAALQSLQEQGRTGLTPQDVVALSQIRQQVAQNAQASNQAILQNMAARGMGGGGAELAAQLSAAQAGAQRESQGSLDVASQAQQRALAAIAQAGGLSSQLRGQEFGEQSARAQAADAIARFNAANQQAVQERNVGMLNQSQLLNLQNAQRIADQNAQMRNQQSLYNQYYLPEQQFQNQMSIAGGRAHALGAESQYYGQQAANTAGQWGQIGQGVGTAASGYAMSKSMGPRGAAGGFQTAQAGTDPTAGMQTVDSGYFGGAGPGASAGLTDTNQMGGSGRYRLMGGNDFAPSPDQMTS